MPVRPIPKNYRNVTGRLPARDDQPALYFESTLERDAYLFFDFDINVDFIDWQPVEVQYTLDGKQRIYTPDLLVLYRRDIEPAGEMHHLLIEVKYRSDIAKNWPELKPKFKAAIRYAKERGWRFKILTENEIRTCYLENARFLSHYRNHEIEDSHYDLLTGVLYELGESDPQTLLLKATNSEWYRAQLLYSLWHLIATYQIKTDLGREKLNMKSRIWFP